MNHASRESAEAPTAGVPVDDASIRHHRAAPEVSAITDEPGVLDRVEASLAVAGVRTVRTTPRELVVVPRDAGEILACGGIVLDERRRRCTIDGASVSLTPREATLLAALVRSCPRPMSREELLASIWGEGFVGDSNVADVHLSNLRRKIGHHRIETIRNIGVRLRH